MRKQITLFAWLCIFVCMQSFAQDRTITGRVTSSQDTMGIPGVSVVVEGTTIGTLSDMDGNFSLSVPASATKLRFSSVGMKSKSVDIGPTTTNVSAVLEPNVTKLDEVVVTANAISREKRSLGYATQQVSGTELTAGQNSNFIGAIQGKVSGVDIRSLSGAPGSSQRIVIRGGTSIGRNNQALLVVDGIPIDNRNFRTVDPTDPLLNPDDLNNQVDFGNHGNDINPNDIESISVLKGPAATALYGSSASNGAIIITTKKGKRTYGGKSKTEVAFNTNVTFSSILKLPTFQNTYGQGDLDNTFNDRRENFSWGLPFDGKDRPWGQEINGKQRVKPYEAQEDNVKDFFDIGTAYTNNLSFSGGTDKSAFYLSLNALNSKGIVPTSKYDKYNVRFNGSTELANHFNTSVNVEYTNIKGHLPSGGQQNASIYDQLIQTPRDIPITDSKDLDDPFSGYNDVTGTYGFYGAYTINPYFVLHNYNNDNKVDRLLGNITVAYTKFKWVTISDRLGGDIYTDRRTEKWKKYSYSPIDPFYAGNDQVYNGKYSEDYYNFNSINNDLMLSFHRELMKGLDATLLLGQNVHQTTLTNTYVQTNTEKGLILEGYYNLINSNGSDFGVNNYTQQRVVGYYGDLNLAYHNMLFLGLTGRTDKSSTLPKNNNSYFYPGVNASFVFSELFNSESKLKNDIWTYGKLRASWAKVGNDATPYKTLNVFKSTVIDGGFGTTTFPFGDVGGYTVNDIINNPDIKPEFTTAFEVGTEMGFLKDRISFDFSYYQNKSTDQIINLPLPTSSGAQYKVINTGEVDNNGIELSAKLSPVSNKNFKWELYGTYTKNNNEVVSLYQGVDKYNLGGTSRVSITAAVGKPYGAFYAVDLLHTDQNDPNSPVVIDQATGLPLTTANQVYVGNYQPDWIASWGTTITYKGIALNVLFDTKQGGVFYSRTKDVMDFVGTAEETVDRSDKVWPNSVYQNPDGSYTTNTSITYHPYDYFTANIPDGQHMVDASFVKLREASLSYVLPAKWLAKTVFGSASISLFGNNLFLWTAKENKYADPEQNSSGSGNTQGFDFTANPSQRNYGVDLKVTF
jgi:TonB-linked SusC/RagA family outer membrane protein